MPFINKPSFPFESSTSQVIARLQHNVILLRQKIRQSQEKNKRFRLYSLTLKQKFSETKESIDKLIQQLNFRLVFSYFVYVSATLQQHRPFSGFRFMGRLFFLSSYFLTETAIDHVEAKNRELHEIFDDFEKELEESEQGIEALRHECTQFQQQCIRHLGQFANI